MSSGGGRKHKPIEPPSPEQSETKGGKKTSVFQRLGGVSVSPIKAPAAKLCTKFIQNGNCQYGDKCRYLHDQKPSDHFSGHMSRHHQDKSHSRSKLEEDTTVIVSTHVGSDSRQVAKVSKDHPQVKAMKVETNKEAEVILLKKKAEELRKCLSELGPPERSTTSTASEESSSNGQSGSGEESSSSGNEDESGSDSQSSSGDRVSDERDKKHSTHHRSVLKSTGYPPVIYEGKHGEKEEPEKLSKSEFEPRLNESFESSKSHSKDRVSPKNVKQKSSKLQTSVVSKVPDHQRKRTYDKINSADRPLEHRAKRAKPHTVTSPEFSPSSKDFKRSRQPPAVPGNRVVSDSENDDELHRRPSGRAPSRGTRAVKHRSETNHEGEKFRGIHGKQFPDRPERFDGGGFSHDWQDPAADKRRPDDQFDRKRTRPNQTPKEVSVRDSRTDRSGKPVASVVRRFSPLNQQRVEKHRLPDERRRFSPGKRLSPTRSHPKGHKKSGGNAVPLRAPNNSRPPSPPVISEKRRKDDQQIPGRRGGHVNRSRTPTRDGRVDAPQLGEGAGISGRNVEFRDSRGPGQFRDIHGDRRQREEVGEFGRRTDFNRGFPPQQQRRDYRDSREFAAPPDREFFNDFPRGGQQDNLPSLMDLRVPPTKDKTKVSRPGFDAFGPDRRRNEFERDLFTRGGPDGERFPKDVRNSKDFGRDLDDPAGSRRGAKRGVFPVESYKGEDSRTKRSRSPLTIKRGEKYPDKTRSDFTNERSSRDGKKAIEEAHSRDSSRSARDGRVNLSFDQKTSSNSSKSSKKSEVEDRTEDKQIDKSSESSGAQILLKSSPVGSRSSSEQRDSKSLKDTESTEELSKETVSTEEEQQEEERRSKSTERSRTPIRDEKAESPIVAVKKDDKKESQPASLPSAAEKQKVRDSIKREERSRGLSKDKKAARTSMERGRLGRRDGGKAKLTQREKRPMSKKVNGSKERLRSRERHGRGKEKYKTEERTQSIKDAGRTDGRSRSREAHRNRSGTVGSKSSDKGRPARSFSTEKSGRSRKESKGDSSIKNDEKGKSVESEDKTVTKIVAPGLSNDAELEPISDDELDNMGDSNCEESAKPKNISIAESLQVNWGSLLATSKPPLAVETAGCRRSRYRPAAMLASLGISEKYAGPKLVEEMTDFLRKSDSVVKYSGQQSFRFLSGLGMLHSNEMRNQKERETLFSNVGSFRQALSARADLQVRRQLCKLSGKISDSAISSEAGIPFNDELHKKSVEMFMKKVEMTSPVSPPIMPEAAV